MRKLCAATAILLSIAGSAYARDKLLIQQYQGTYGNAAAVVAAAQGMCERNGLDCEIKYINSGPLGMQALVGKSIDVAFVGTETLVTGIARGAKAQLVYGGYQSLTLSLVARNDVPIRKGTVKETLEQLKGKRIGVTMRGSQTEMHFLSLVREAGMKPSDFIIVPVGGVATAYTALTVGKTVDAVMIMNPLKQICVEAKTCQLVFDADTVEWPPELRAMKGASVAMAMRTETIEQNPDLVNRFIRAMDEANKWIRDPKNRDAVVKLLGPSMTLGDIPNADAVRRSWINDDITQMGDGKLSRSGVQGVVDYLSAQGLIDSKPAVSSLVYRDAP
ncbi:ABC transporter substrate-binding protein [Paraburkholderia susongensis]|uniref:ABC-type nitrate/sulfonate/bicarbonate transport system, substrate-binding protein n=1 Tax=Paraburkholderia susongensis TaxID=1515439 RepID=A0A1X7LGP3_9BURK|nr:ABC transporter substrate-binding protein [Paraburkholderia susongensis]SMG52955.1 ABC-type nitrate/sulfonate/bicarbonate transport system, substrate-binding protein [Paraburkholderia susongensis]